MRKLRHEICDLRRDGMADLPIPELDGRTPLEYAVTPNMDRVAAMGNVGLAQTIPDGLAPGSDVANMSLIGYDASRYYHGRAPIEAASMGVKLAPEDVAFRCKIWLPCMTASWPIIPRGISKRRTPML